MKRIRLTFEKSGGRCLCGAWVGYAVLATAPLFGQINGGTLGFYAPSSAANPAPVSLAAQCPYTVNNVPYLPTGCSVSINVAPVSQTNGHLHEGGAFHPFSKLSSAASGSSTSADGSQTSGVTDATGNFYFTLTPTLVGQTETITAVNAFGSEQYSYNVGYNDLVFGQFASWTLIGATDSLTSVNTGHGGNANNHWMTTQTYYDLTSTTQAWTQARGNCMICVNDSALPWGGKFDIESASRWMKPHVSHDRGSAVDIATGVATAGCPYPVDGDKFLSLCKANGFNQTSSIYEKTKNHDHCNSLNPATYAYY